MSILILNNNMEFCIILIITFYSSSSVKCAPIQSNEENDLNFMREMGLMLDTNDTTKMKNVVKDFQKSTNLTVTGILDKTTKIQMKNTPRCLQFYKESTKEDSIEKIQINITGKWRQTDLTYSFINYSTIYKKPTVEDSVQKGIKLWMDASALTFERIEDKSTADITIHFVDEIPSTNESQAVLANAAPPGDGRIFFADNATASLADLNPVTVHELGHTLGFNHIDNISSVMYPLFVPKSTLQLSESDIITVQNVYGKKYSLCEKGKIDAALFIPETKTVYMMKGRRVWKFSDNKLLAGYPKYLSQEFPGLRNGVNASFYYNNDIYFIQGKNVLKFNKTYVNKFDTLDAEYQAALVYGERLYTFKDSEYWRYDINDTGMTKVRKSYPRNITSLWLGVPKNINAVYYDYDVHFFRRSRYYRFDANLKIPAVKMNISDWEGCKN